MSRPLENLQIDRLVDGELPEGERRELLQKLDAEADGWRRCALAFLEAQSWRATFGSMAIHVASTPKCVVPAQAGSRQKPSLRQYVAAVTALAAGIAAAFALGWSLHGRPPESVQSSPTMNSEMASSDKPAPAPIEAVRRDSPPPEKPDGAHLLDPVVKQWEQRGFHAERQNRLVSVELKDGKKIEVPVHEVRFQNVRGRTY